MKVRFIGSPEDHANPEHFTIRDIPGVSIAQLPSLLNVQVPGKLVPIGVKMAANNQILELNPQRLYVLRRFRHEFSRPELSFDEPIYIWTEVEPKL